jgi:hypothetical protein
MGYFVVFFAGLCWAFLPRTPELALFNALALPWFTIGITVLNLPFVAGVFRGIKLPLSARRNHALEHGTIQLILKAYGIRKGLGGKAESDGFRIFGARSEADIRRAFAEFVALPYEEKMTLAVSRHCGSMLVVAEGLGILLVVATITVVLIWQPDTIWITLLLGGQLVLFLTMRHAIGRIIQVKRLLSLDFSSARIQSIRKVPANYITEKPPVYFVQTDISIIV